MVVYTDLEGLTGKESGLLLWEDDYLITNWRGQGIPRIFARVQISLNERFTAERCEVPQNAIGLMQEHEIAEREAGQLMPKNEISTEGFKAWKISVLDKQNDIKEKLIVVTQEDWN